MSTEKNSPVALVTGSAHRIGACIVRRLHSKGYRVIIHYHSSAEPAEEQARAFNAQQPGTAATAGADLADAEQLDKLAEEALAHFGRVDVLVNNASRFHPTPMGDVTLTQWDNLVNTNLRAPFFLSQALSPALRESRGCIVNITDVYGHRPLANHPVYSMTKAGLIMLTHSLASELGPEVRVNAVSPGAILGPDSGLQDRAKTEILQSTSLKRLGDPEDIAATAEFLIEADYVTGQVVAVDGGRLVNI